MSIHAMAMEQERIIQALINKRGFDRGKANTEIVKLKKSFIKKRIPLDIYSFMGVRIMLEREEKKSNRLGIFKSNDNKRPKVDEIWIRKEDGKEVTVWKIDMKDGYVDYEVADGVSSATLEEFLNDFRKKETKNG